LLSLLFSRIFSFVFSKTIEHPMAKCGKSSSISFEPEVVVFHQRSKFTFKKSYSGLEFPTKSKTVKQSFPSIIVTHVLIIVEKPLNFPVGLKKQNSVNFGYILH
jgi:hypothetical protein